MFFSKRKEEEIVPEENDGVLDLDSLDDGLGFKVTTAGGRTKEFGKEFLKGVTGGESRRNMLRGFITGALPPSYSHIYHAAEDAWTAIRRNVDKARDENADALLDLTQMVERQVPRLKSRLPGQTYNRLEGKIRDSRKRLQESVGYNDARNDTPENQDARSIQDALINIGAYSEAKAEARANDAYLKNQATLGYRHSEENQQFKANYSILQEMRDDISRQTNYQSQVTSQFQRKSIELGYRQYFALRDIRRLTAVGLDLNRSSMDSMIHNTGLTEAQKQQFAVRGLETSTAVDEALAKTGGTGLPGGGQRGFSYADTVRRNLANQGFKKYQQSIPKYTAEFFPKIGENLQKSFTEYLRGANMAGGMAENFMDSPDLSAGQMGNMGGGVLGQLLGKYIAPRLGARYQADIERMGRRLNGKNYSASYAIDNASSLLQDFGHNYNSDDGFVKTIARGMVRANVPEYRLNNRLDDASFQTINKATTFNHLSQRSLVEIIPGYLSRILHVNRMMFEGTADVERETYDITKGRFVSVKDAKQSIAKRIVTESQRENINATLTDLVNTYKGDEKLSDSATLLLRDRLMREAGVNGRFDPEELVKGDFGDDVDNDTRDELIKFMRKRFDFDSDGKLKQDYENLKRRDEYSREFSRLRDVMPNSRAEITRIHGTGSQELLRELGVVYAQHGRDYISYQRLWAMYRGDDPTAIPPGESEPLDGGPPSGFEGEDFDGEDAEGDGKPKAPKKSITQQRLEALGKEKLAGGQSALDRWREKRRKQGLPPLHMGPRSSVEETPAEEPPVMPATERVEKRSEKSVKGRFKDLYSSGHRRILLWRDVLAGRYKDVNTGKVIESLDDITGPVVDDAGNEALSAEDFEKGVYDVEGAPVFTGQRFWKGKNAADTLQEKVLDADKRQEAVQKARSIGHRLSGLKDALLKKKPPLYDAYMPGEESPRIRANDLIKGRYSTGKGKTIYHFDDVADHDVLDENMNVVVAYDELEFLVDAKGNAHPIAKNRTVTGNLKRMTRRAARGYLNWSKEYYKKLPGRLLKTAMLPVRGVKWGVDRLRGVPEEVKKGGFKDRVGIMGRRFREGTATHPESEYEIPDYTDSYGGSPMGPPAPERAPSPATGLHGGPKAKRGRSRFFKWLKDDEKDVHPEAITSTTDALLNRINNRLDPEHEKPREGSWQEQMAEREEAERLRRQKEHEERSKNGNYTDVVDQFKGLLSGIGGAFAGLKNMLGGGGGDTTLMGNPADLAGGRDRDGRRNRGGGARGGWMKRTWQGLTGVAGGTMTGRALRGVGVGARVAALFAGGLAATPAGALILGGAAIAGGGYYLWRRYKQTRGALLKHRMSQYGVDPTERSEAIPVLTLEKELEGVTSRDGDGNVSIQIQRANIQGIVEAFGIADDDEEAGARFVEWLNTRFLPVYHAHHKALGIVQSTAPLTSVDDDIEPDKALEYLNLVNAVTSQVKDIYASPFGVEHQIGIDETTIQGYYDEAVKEYTKKADPVNNITNRQELMQYAAGLRAERREQAIADGTYVPSLREQMAARPVGEVSENDAVVFRSNLAAPRPNFELSPIQKIRLFAYGLSHLDDDYVDALLGIEDAVFENISYTADKQAEFKGSVDGILSDHAEAIGVAWNQDFDKTRRWRTWFTKRFIPVVLQYAGKLKQMDRGARLSGHNRNLGKDVQLAIARAILGAKHNGWFSNTPIWEIDAAIFVGHNHTVSLEKAQEVVEALIQSESAAATSANTPSSSLAPPSNIAKPDGDTGAAAGVMSDRMRDIHQRATQYINLQNPANSGGRYNAHVLGVHEYGYGVPGLDTPRQPGGAVTSAGAVYGGLLSGTGGAFEDIPLPSANKDRAAAMPTLQAVQSMTGVNADLLATFAKIESNFDYLVKAPTSSATGWFQFIDKTWRAVIDQYGGQYGIPQNLPEAQLMELKKDPRINALMGAELLKENHRAVTRSTGREPTDTDLYLAHFMGAGRAGQVLNAPDMNAIAAQLYPDAAKANKWVFYKDPDNWANPRTVGEIIQWADSKVAPGRVGGQSTASHYTPDEATGTNNAPRPTVDPSGSLSLQAGLASGNADLLEGSMAGSENVRSGFANIHRRTQQSAIEAASSGAYQRVLDNTTRTTSATPSAVRTPEVSAAETVESEEARSRRLLDNERRERERVETSQTQSMAMGGIAEQQLQAQLAMEGYLKRLADNMDLMIAARGDLPAAPTPGDTTRAPSPPTSGQSGRPQQGGYMEQASVSMTR